VVVQGPEVARSAKRIPFIGVLLLRYERTGRRTHSGELYDHLTIFGPDVVRRAFWLGEECARRIGFELRLVPLLAYSEIVCPGEHHAGAPLIGMEMRHQLEARGKLDAQYVRSRFSWVAKSNGCLETRADSGSFPDDVLWHDGKAFDRTLGVSNGRRDAQDEQESQTNSARRHCFLLAL